MDFQNYMWTFDKFDDDEDKNGKASQVAAEG
jgi:hypothetical protein